MGSLKLPPSVLFTLCLFGLIMVILKYKEIEFLELVLSTFVLISLLGFSFLLMITKLKKSRSKRRAFSQATKESVKLLQGGVCAECGEIPKHWDFDHINSRSNNSIKNCQGLCLDCHRTKTNRERHQRDPRI